MSRASGLPVIGWIGQHLLFSSDDRVKEVKGIFGRARISPADCLFAW